jgi:hypothetical protein
LYNRFFGWLLTKAAGCWWELLAAERSCHTIWFNGWLLGELLAAGIAVGESDKERCWPWAVGELVGFNKGLSVGEMDGKVLAMGELVGNNERG